MIFLLAVAILIQVIIIIMLGFLLSRSMGRSLALESDVAEARDICKDLITDLALSKEGVITWKKNLKDGTDLEKENKELKEKKEELQKRLDLSNEFNRLDILDLEE